MDTDKFISIIRKRECLWNQNYHDYHARDVQRRHWEEVAEECNGKVEDIKRKWRSLRDTFRREYKKVITRKPGDEYIPRWPHYNLMMFLYDTIPARDATREPDDSGASDNESESEYNYLTENDCGTTSHRPSSDSRQSSRRSFKTPFKKISKYRRDPLSDFDNKILQVMEEKLKILKRNRDDSEMKFLMSLHPFLKKIPSSRQLTVRSNMMKVLMGDESFLKCESPVPSQQSEDDDWGSSS